MSTLRLLSNNQWACDDNCPEWAAKGMDCSAAVREKGFARLYSEVQPDVIGGQEVTARMAQELMRELGKLGLRYALLWGKDTPILYRPDKLEVIDADFGLYPEEIPGLVGSFNNYETKSWNLAVFRVKETGGRFIFVSTHLWWMSSDPASRNYQAGSDEARAWQLRFVASKAEEYRAKYHCPAVLVGDLNSEPDKEALRAAFSLGWKHGHDLATEYADDSRGYHWCGRDGFTPMFPGGFADAIDHILLSGAPEGAVKRFERYTPEYYMPLSDHSPVWIDAEF